MSALNTLRKSFPQVERVVDAKETIAINVRKVDARSGRRKDPQDCALARACRRTNIADHAIIGLTVSYLIKGNTATRYHTSDTVGREITSFDRHKDFAAGRNYKLSKISPSCQEALGAKHRGGAPTGKGKKRSETMTRHHTVRVRKLTN